MNLKLVVASMSVLGLVSCPVFAATTNTNNNYHHHKMVKHHVAHHDYKDMGPVQPAPVEVCTVTPTTVLMEEMTQNYGRAIPNPCNPGWFNRIAVTGGVNVDLGKWGDRNTDYEGENYQHFSLNDAYLNVSAMINDWTNAFLSISYQNATFDGGDASGVYGYSSVYPYDDLSLEQAFFTVGNFDCSPFFLQVGKQFQDFSRYDIHPITASMTQVLSETLRTSVKLGFIVPMGLHGAVYAYDDRLNKFGKTSSPADYGASLGFDQPGDMFGYDIGAAWVYNMIGAGDVAHGVTNFTHVSEFHKQIDAVAAYGDVNYGPFSLSLRYTQALKHFNPLDLPKDGSFDVTGGPIFGTVIPGSDGAHPWAAGGQLGYTFNAWWCKPQNIFLGYQASNEAAGLGLPRSRWELGYGVEPWRNIDFTAQWDHDLPYAKRHGGRGGSSTDLVSIRAAVQFS